MGMPGPPCRILCTMIFPKSFIIPVATNLGLYIGLLCLSPENSSLVSSFISWVKNCLVTPPVSAAGWLFMTTRSLFLGSN